MSDCTGDLRIGTSGWHYKHWRGPFYPERFAASRMLAFYMQHFDTVEINNSFYRLPSTKALASWRENTPPGFCFAVKGSRFLTHMKKLKDPVEGIRRFFDRVDVLAEKTGPVLFQLPPQWPVDAGRLDAFIEALPAYHRYAFEFRNPSWNAPAVLRILETRRVAYCIYDLAGYQSPVTVTTDLVYVRLHGPGGKYQGSYPDDSLRVWAESVGGWRGAGHRVYIYFDNDDSGYAVRNALSLKNLTG